MPEILNATITQLSSGGFRVRANEGYVLHDKNRNIEVMDETTMMPTGEILLGYLPYPAACVVPASYDFENTKVIDGYTAYGSREFFARPQSEVPADQIFTNPNPPAEVMGEETEPESEIV